MCFHNSEVCLWVTALLLLGTGASCVPTQYSQARPTRSSAGPPQPSFVVPDTWPTKHWPEAQARNELDSRREQPEPIEGIWTVSQGGTWRNVASGMTGEIPKYQEYRLAILQDSTEISYDFVAVILESEYADWTPGKVKARIRRTAWRDVYEATWYMRNYSSRKFTFRREEPGVYKTSFVAYDPNNRYIELSYEMVLSKAYPTLGRRKSGSVGSVVSSGTGIVLSDEGLVATCYHVVEEATGIDVVFPGSRVSRAAEVIVHDAENDLAILSVDGFEPTDIASKRVPFSFATAGEVKLGQEAFTLGFPLGDVMGCTPRLSAGRVSSLYGLQDDPRLYQISNPLQPGNSGGALFDTKGRLIGVVVSGLNARYFYEKEGIVPQNVNFAVKSNYLATLVASLAGGGLIARRKSTVGKGSLEKQVEVLRPFVVQVRVY
ncbi:hypothetical protein CH330_03345 [candidate division WOR-3 bacterium JGI_Cruoil_03_51_56]|uniref:Serine protease n=1 Tax=candidate division WOR-3 bacterium JGI_Cruoil_03_51_56 TaxID=1973747 RepID=A0A235BV27_UNCW3|nr:MAG: hypothetical protein CH330_03345 [candidate division WOR-3 bacterium JGI_Cruoil_03_51_56]